MSIRNADAAAAAAARRAAEEAARRRREEEARRAAAKKAAEAAAKKAADAAAKKAAAAAAKKAAEAAAKKKLTQQVSGAAGQRPSVSAVRQAFGRDEMSQGLGRALRQRSAAALGGAPMAQTPIATLRGPPPGGVQAGRLDTRPSSTTEPRTTEPRGPTAQEVYDRELKNTVQKPLSEWTRADAANFTSELADQVEEHKEDPEFVRGLMTISSDRLRTAANLVGEGTEEKGDRGQMEDLTRELTRLGNNLPDDMANRLAAGIAAAIPEDSEQNYVDDGFGKAIENGEDSNFRDLIAGALVTQGKEEAAEELVEHAGGSGLTDRLGDLRERFGDLIDGAGDLAGDAWDFGGEALQVAGEGLEAAGGAIDAVTDAVIPQSVQNVLGNVPTIGPLLHAGQSIEDLGQTIQDFPEFVDAIQEAATYRGQISDLGEGDSFTMGANGDLAISGIVGTLEGEIAINRGDDVDGKPQYTVTVGGELGVGVGGPLAQGVDGTAVATVGGSVEYSFDSPEAAKRGVDILMANAIGRSGLAGGVADATGLTERIFGASNDDLDELSQSQSAVTLSAGAAADLSVSLGADQLALDANVSAEHSVRLEYDHGNISEVTLQTELSGGGSAGAAGVTAGTSGSVSVSQGFDVPPGTSLADLLRNPGALDRQEDAELTFNAEVFGGASAGVGGSGVEASLSANEGVTASATVRGDPVALLRSGALQEITRGNFEGALDALHTVAADLEIEAEVRSFTSTGASAEVGGGSAGSGAHVGVSAEARDYADEALVEFDGDLGDVRAELNRLQDRITRGAVAASELRFLAPIIG